MQNQQQQQQSTSTSTCLVNEIKRLHGLKFFDSAEGLVSTLLASTSGPDHISALELWGDVVFDKKEYRRALQIYVQAFVNKKMVSSGSTRSSGAVPIEDLAKLSFKCCQCHIELKEHSAALKELESIPLKYKTEEMQMCAGKLYLEGGLKRTAISAYKGVVASSPFALEAITALIDLGIEGQDLTSIIDTAAKENRSGNLSVSWVKSFIEALKHKRSGDYHRCVDAFQSIPGVVNNAYFQAHLGAAAVDCTRLDDAIHYFRTARKLSSCNVYLLDHYAYALMVKGDNAELNKLSHSAVAMNDSKRPEGWIIVSLFCQLRGEWAKALNFIDRVCCVLSS
jgi:tetratricopeptide (TPR) repeat protein